MFESYSQLRSHKKDMHTKNFSLEVSGLDVSFERASDGTFCCKACPFKEQSKKAVTDHVLVCMKAGAKVSFVLSLCCQLL